MNLVNLVEPPNKEGRNKGTKKRTKNQSYVDLYYIKGAQESVERDANAKAGNFWTTK